METKEINKIENRGFYRSFFSLTTVIVLQNLLLSAVGLADNIMIGRYSETAMNGVSLANQIQFLLQMLVTGLANGVSVLAAQYWGKRKTEPIKRIFSAACVIGVAINLLMSVTVIAAPQAVLSLLTDKQPEIEEGAKYIALMGFTYIISSITTLLLGMLRSVETVKIGFAVTTVSLCVNIFLNYAMIFGHFGFPELGVKGAAYATITARVTEFVIVMIYTLIFDKKIKLRLKDFFIIEKDYALDFVKSGLPLTFSGVSWGIAMTVQTAILGRIDSPFVLGANNIAATVFNVSCVLYNSTANSSSIIIGKTVGEHDFDRVKRYAKKLQLIFLAIGAVSCVIMAAAAKPVVALFRVSEGTAQMAETFIYILAVTIIGSSYEAPCLCGIVSGGGDTKFVFYNDLIFMWGIVIPMSALSAFVFKLPIPVTFFMLKADQILKCFVAIVKVNRFKWIKELTR